jgi:tetratricopeptide (TPR) repeat protein
LNKNGIGGENPSQQVTSVLKDERKLKVPGRLKDLRMHRRVRAGVEQAEKRGASLRELALQYQGVLARSPGQPDALIGLSLVALASRQYEAAVRMAAAAVNAAPGNGSAWVALGQGLKSAGRAGEAEQAYREAIRRDGLNPLARLGLGELRLAGGEPEGALGEYDLALQRRPGMAAAHLGRGHALASMGKNAEALACYEQVLAFAPRMAEAEFGAAFVQARLGRSKEAERHYRRALTLRPDFAAAWMNLGCLLREEGREVYAEAALRRAVELRPELIAGWINLAGLKREQRLPDAAEGYLRRAFALDPGKVETQLAWCQFCAAEKDLAGAREWLRWALARDATNVEAVNMQGVLLYSEGRFADAVCTFEQAEAMGSRSAASNRGNCLMDLGRMQEALQAHEEAVARDPQSSGARYNLALTRLRLGDWKQGWADYEARWHFREVHRTPVVFRQPRWRGEPLEGRRILLHAEQGLGDAIQFCRFAEMVAARGGRVILQVHTAVERLARSLAVVREGRAEVAQLGAEPPPFDVESPLMSLPAVFGTTTETVPWQGPYLHAEAELVEARRAELGEAGGRAALRVGFAWAGNPRYKTDARRSMKLATWIPLLRTPGVDWISLQKGEAAGQLAVLPEDVAVWDGCNGDRDLAETAAMMEQLDLVITTDTCIAHLAGAMGKPAWILLPYLADWRWMETVETTPWYPTARLVRQRVPGCWAEVLERVASELKRKY